MPHFYFRPILFVTESFFMSLFSPSNWFKQRFARWTFRRSVTHGVLYLSLRTVYIIPSKQGIAFCLLLVLMLLSDINYNLSLGYALTFLLATVGGLSMLYTFRNLSALSIRAGAITPVFMGDLVQFTFHFENLSSITRYQLHLQDNANHRQIFDLAPSQTSVIHLSILATQRGWLESGRLTLFSRFPFGLFHAWTYLHFDSRGLVYPKPALPTPLPWHGSVQAEGKILTANGEDDFAGLRNYVQGDALAHVAWKALARGQSLQIKQFSGTQNQTLWLDWAQLPPNITEQNLSTLTRWVIEADAANIQFGLRLPQLEISPNQGAAHQANCLRALALFEV
jgi:uncharacterized protein (DUF58 family)